MKEEAYITYGMVSRLSIENLMELKEFIKDKEIRIVFDKISPKRIYLVEADPSGSRYDSQ